MSVVSSDHNPRGCWSVQARAKSAKNGSCTCGGGHAVAGATCRDTGPAYLLHVNYYSAPSIQAENISSRSSGELPTTAQHNIPRLEHQQGREPGIQLADFSANTPESMVPQRDCRNVYGRTIQLRDRPVERASLNRRVFSIDIIAALNIQEQSHRLQRCLLCESCVGLAYLLCTMAILPSLLGVCTFVPLGSSEGGSIAHELFITDEHTLSASRSRAILHCCQA